MGRKILITKTQQTTIVAIWDERTPNKKEFFSYNKGADITVKDGVMAVEHPYGLHHKLVFTFDELDDNLGAADIEQYQTALADGLFFLVSDGGGAGLGGGQDNKPLYIRQAFYLGGVGYPPVNTVDEMEAAVYGAINNFFQTSSFTVLETEIPIFIFDIYTYGSFSHHVRKYLLPNGYGKGEYIAPTIFPPSELELIYIGNTNPMNPIAVTDDVNNIIIDLGTISVAEGDLWNYLNTTVNATYPTGYPLSDNTKMYYFKYIDGGTTYMYYFDVENTVNGYGMYGNGGTIPFTITDLYLFYKSSTAVSSTGNYQTRPEKMDSIAALGNREYIDTTEESYMRVTTSTSNVIKHMRVDAGPTPNAYPGKEYTIKNEKGVNITINHMDATGGGNPRLKKFYIPGATNLTLAPQESATFHFCTGNDRFELISRNLASAGSGTWPAHIEYDETDKTLWSNGKGNVSSNSSYGENVLQSCTGGMWNTGMGFDALQALTSGNGNSAFGNAALRVAADRSHNSAFGNFALTVLTVGDQNAAFGASAGSNLTTGGYNTFLGQFAGSRIATGASLTNCDSSIYVGMDARASANGVTNEIAIGGTGLGSNTAVIGNSNVTLTRLRGKAVADQLAIQALNTAPASATATGTLGEIRIDANYIYVCVATNSWKRVAIAAW